jgi:hypothetical protein
MPSRLGLSAQQFVAFSSQLAGAQADRTTRIAMVNGPELGRLHGGFGVLSATCPKSDLIRLADIAAGAGFIG